VFGSERRTAPKMPLTPIVELVLDLAVLLELNPMRKALANLEYRRLIDMRTLESAASGRGRRGAGKLRLAIARHLPHLATTKSPWEDRLLFVLEGNDVPLPDATDTCIEGEEVDSVWYAAKLVVEIDGEGNHGTWGQGRRDRRKDMKLRELGYLVLRYTPDQLESEPARVAADILNALISRTAISA
jgi:hypothetical protein